VLLRPRDQDGLKAEDVRMAAVGNFKVEVTLAPLEGGEVSPSGRSTDSQHAQRLGQLVTHTLASMAPWER